MLFTSTLQYPDRLVPMREILERLGCSRFTLKRAIQAGTLPPLVVLSKRCRYYSESTLNQIFANEWHPAAPDEGQKISPRKKDCNQACGEEIQAKPITTPEAGGGGVL